MVIAGGSSNFRFETAARILFGRGVFDRIGTLMAEHGKSALIVSNADRSGRLGLMSRLERLASEESVATEVYWIRGEPEIATVDDGLDHARRMGANVVVGIGGGSAMDTAKAVAGLLTNEGSCIDYMEVIGAGRVIRRPALPWIAVPTTAGTGAEVTRNAVIGSKKDRYKASIRSPYLLARTALVDPELGLGVPREVTARSGMDALVQCIESYTSNGANPLTDGLAREGVRRAGRSLRRAVRDGDDLAAREDMALAALISGITLTSGGLGAVHGFAAGLGARYPAPHGTICAALLPHVLRANVAALRASDADHPWLGRYADVGRTLRGEPDLDVRAAEDAGPEIASSLVRDLEIPGLGEFGVEESEIDVVVSMAQRASSMKFNPVELSATRLAEILRSAL
jgi:alcohol dehydrogenase class IV